MADEEKEEIRGPDFVIVDRRAREPEAEKPAEEPAPEAKAEAAREPEEPAEAAPEAEAAGAEEVADVYGTIGFAISLLHQQAWHLMGLVPNPITKEYTKDFDQARVAIDCVAFLAGKLEGSIGDEEMRGLRALVADLQLNFAKQKGAG